MSRELLKQALEALKGYRQNHDDHQPCDAEKAIETFLAHPEPEPVASINGWYGGYPTICIINGAVLPAGTALYTTPPDQSARIAELEEKIKELERSLRIRYNTENCGTVTNVVEMPKDELRKLIADWIKADTLRVEVIRDLEQQLAALQAKREPLSDAVVFNTLRNLGWSEDDFELIEHKTCIEIARAIEAAHGIGTNHE